MRKAMEELLYKARVDAVFAGHVHAYERFVSPLHPVYSILFVSSMIIPSSMFMADSTRIYDNKVDPCGPMYITIGDGGNREGLALTFENPASPLSLYREASFGHGRLRMVDETRAHWSWHRNNDSNSFSADEVWLDSLSTSAACWEIGGDEKEPPKSIGDDEL
ncbi:hypothetical protein OIU78_014539 [Salix suchowensis]|nr:hypothetical protein OIU78_014539 [Salix suchowensis]